MYFIECPIQFGCNQICDSFWAPLKLLETSVCTPCVSASVCATCVCVTVSTGAHTRAISLHDNCQCVRVGWFIGPESGGLPRKEGSPSNWKWADAGLKLTAFQYANFLGLFICLLMTSGSSQGGIFFSFSEKKTNNADIFPVDHLSLVHQSQAVE